MPSSFTPPVRRVPIALGDRSYEILIGRGLLQDPAAWQGLPQADCALIVTNPTVATLYASGLQHALAPHYARVLTVELPDGDLGFVTGFFLAF